MKVSTMVDPHVRIFDFKLIRVTVLIHSYQQLGDHTPKIAKKYFGNTDPMGKSLRYSWEDTKQLFTIAGIAAQAPEESSIKSEILIPYSN
jgi:hypothetical protein